MNRNTASKSFQFLRSFVCCHSVLLLTASIFTASAYAQSPASPTTLGKISGNFRCEIDRKEQSAFESLKVVFEVTNGIVKKFTSSWALSSDHPDLRPGYTTTSQFDLNDLQQIQQPDEITLKIKSGVRAKNQENCRIKIYESQTSTNVSSSECSSPSLALNIAIDKKTGACRKDK